MNYSYVMAVNNANELIENGFNVQLYDGDYLVSFTDDKITFFEEFILKNLQNGFWNEYLGKETVFIFKFEDGRVEKYILNNSNEEEILKLCRKFANNNFESIDKMLRGNEFYNTNYYKCKVE